MLSGKVNFLCKFDYSNVIPFYVIIVLFMRYHLLHLEKVRFIKSGDVRMSKDDDPFLVLVL